MILLRKEAVEQFEHQFKCASAKKIRHANLYDGSAVIPTAMQVQAGAYKKMQLLEKQQEIYKGQHLSEIC